MEHSESQLREIAQGRRLPLETKLFGVAVLVLVAMNLLFQWNSERLALLFFGLGMLSYLARRINAIAHFVFEGDHFDKKTEKVEVDA